jgi:hypothetical protein
MFDPCITHHTQNGSFGSRLHFCTMLFSVWLFQRVVEMTGCGRIGQPEKA